MPSKKGSIAYEMRLLRRKAQRRIKSLEREAAKTKSASERKLFESSIESIKRQVAQTYQRTPQGKAIKNVTQESLRIAKQNLTRTTEVTRSINTAQARRNFIARQELNAADKGATMGNYTEAEVSIFYSATKAAWQGHSNAEDRNQLILSYYGRTDLESFVDEVLRLNLDVIKELVRKQQNQQGELTEEQLERYGADVVEGFDSKEIDRIVQNTNSLIAQTYTTTEPEPTS